MLPRTSPTRGTILCSGPPILRPAAIKLEMGMKKKQKIPLSMVLVSVKLLRVLPSPELQVLRLKTEGDRLLEARRVSGMGLGGAFRGYGVGLCREGTMDLLMRFGFLFLIYSVH